MTPLLATIAFGLLAVVVGILVLGSILFFAYDAVMTLLEGRI